MSRSTRNRLIALAAALAVTAVGNPARADDNATPGDLASLDTANLQLGSVHAAIADMDNGVMLYMKNADERVPIASITKLMTAMVVLDSGEPLDEWLTIVKRHHKAPNNAYSHIRLGSELQRGDLLRIALMASENRAAYVLARHHPGGLDAFVDAMNAKAKSLGMEHTHFAGPTGLSPRTQSTAADLSRMIQAAAQYDHIREYTTTSYYAVHFRNPEYTLHYGNTDALVYRNRWNIGLSKTGYLNEAGRCLAVVTEIDGHELAIVLLDSFGSHTPIGDVGRVEQWVETGSSGHIARAALRYEQRRTAEKTAENTE